MSRTAPEKVQAPAPAPVAPTPAPEPKAKYPSADYCVGVRKVGPNKYVAVMLTVDGDKIIERQVHDIEQDLGLTSGIVRMALAQLMGRIP